MLWQTMRHKRSNACLTCSVAGCGYSCCQGQWGKEGQASHLSEIPLFIKATPKYFKSDMQQVILGEGGEEEKLRRMGKDRWGRRTRAFSAHSAHLAALFLCFLQRSCIYS